MKRALHLAIPVAMFVALLSPRADAGDATPADRALARADALWADGEFDACLATLEQLHGDLPDDARLLAWEILPSPSVASQFAVGKRYLYYTHMIPGKSTGYPGFDRSLGTLTLYASDWRYAIVCIDAEAGKVAWAWNVIGLPRAIVAHPTTDALTMVSWNFGTITLEAETGKVVERQSFKEVPGGVKGLWVSGRVVLRSGAYAPAALWDLAAKRPIRIDLKSLQLMSPDESKRLSPGRQLECTDLKGKTFWTFTPAEGASGVAMPRWLDGDVVWAVNTPVHGALLRIDAATGKLRWRMDLEDRAGRFAPFMLGGHLAVVDGLGRLHLVDPESGQAAAVTRPFGDLVCEPALIGDRGVFCTTGAVFAVSTKFIFNRSAVDERVVLVRKARCLLSLSRPVEARALMDDLLRLDGRCADAWLQRAEACRALDDERDEAFSRCRYLALAGKSSDDRLRDRYGLVQLITLGSRPSWQVQPGSRTNLMPHGPRLYVGTTRGEIWEINTQSLEARRFTETDGPVAWLWTKTAVTASIPVGGRYQHVPVTLPDDPEKPDKADARWWTVTGYDGRPVRWRGRHYLPMGGGKVRVLDDGHSVEYASPIEGITSWEIHLSPEGPLGYGRGGVYALDEHLCPVRRLMTIALGGKPATSLNVKFLRSTADTLGVVAGGREGRFLQVYTRDGARLLNEISLSNCGSRRDYPPQFLVLGNGYFFSSRSLSWAGASKGQVWRFGPPPERTLSDRQPPEPLRFFGDPVVHDGKLFVTAVDGCVYIFDVARITRAQQ